MSYCRWSSDFGECDVYVYEDVHGGWTTHVGSRRLKQKVPDNIKNMYPEFGDPQWAEKYMNCEKAADEWRRTLKQNEKSSLTFGFPVPDDSEYFDLKEIGEEAGQSYNHPTPGECADNLVMLKNKGFNVPQYAIDALREEENELNKN